MFHATTILAVKKDGHTAVAGDGQVTMGNAVIMKNTARKVRRLYHGKVIAGFAGSVADAFALFDKFESKLVDCNGNLVRAAVEFAKEWRSDRVLQKLEALLIMIDGEHLFLVSGSGEVIEPDDGILAIGSGGSFRQAGGTQSGDDLRGDDRAVGRSGAGAAWWAGVWYVQASAGRSACGTPRPDCGAPARSAE